MRAGGDDYLTKPFAIAELIARIEALLRRPAESRDTILRIGPLEADLLSCTAKGGDLAVERGWTRRGSRGFDRFVYECLTGTIGTAPGTAPSTH